MGVVFFVVCLISGFCLFGSSRREVMCSTMLFLVAAALLPAPVVPRLVLLYLIKAVNTLIS
ncbi:hypothetical protein EJB05_00491 [Eragrostis curvula]|uniref:Uncharacterized protein n=2 Tax=Eragrostis curvula TaxID=38414 RepID=A0A5J9WM62_9POAL|nr:hypothetical protein EJB05_00491 [Eragrostis curvula]